MDDTIRRNIHIKIMMNLLQVSYDECKGYDIILRRKSAKNTSFFNKMDLCNKSHPTLTMADRVIFLSYIGRAYIMYRTSINSIRYLFSTQSSDAYNTFLIFPYNVRRIQDVVLEYILL